MKDADKEGVTVPAKDIPLKGVEKKADKAECGHSYCRDDVCRLDAMSAAVDQIGSRLDALTKHYR